MPSRFPGMDPYLEAPAVWPGVHARLIDSIGDQLVPLLRPRYIVDIERRVYVLNEDDPARRQIVPDLTVLRSPGSAPRQSATTPATRRSPAVLHMVADEIEVRESRLVVRAVGDRALVTVIEVLSPANKAAGSRGRDEYLSKRREVLRSSVHMIEIDLLRAGNPIPSVDPLPEGDYHVHVSRAPLRPRGEVFSWSLRDSIPEILVPLSQGDADVVLDLGAAVRSVYDRGGYDLVVDYGAPLDPPLRSEDAGWAASLLKR